MVADYLAVLAAASAARRDRKAEHCRALLPVRDRGSRKLSTLIAVSRGSFGDSLVAGFVGSARMKGMLETGCTADGKRKASQRQILLTTTSAVLFLTAGAAQTKAQQVIFDGAVEPGDTASIDGSTDIYVGTTAPGTLSILDGAEPTSARAIIGESSIGEVIVSGAGSRWESTVRVSAGVDSLGRVVLADQATAEGVAAVIGSSVRGDALLTSGAS